MTSVGSLNLPSEGTRQADLAWPWLMALLAVGATFAFSALQIAEIKPPGALVPIAAWITTATEWFTANFRFLFRTITWGLTGPMNLVRVFIDTLAWPTVIILITAIGYAANGKRLAAFCGLAFLYIVITGYWDKTAVTLALVAVAVPVSVAIGLFGGILAYRSAIARRIIEPILDLMQTIPTFAYLIPILVLFGIGPVVGMIASAIYAIPPMVRNVMLGLQRVHPEIIESAKMSGSTERQLLWWVMIPSSMPTILVGVNQTVMASLSMVVIASMVGGVDDIGIEIFQSMKLARFGESLLSGLVVALIAMVMDRVSRGFAMREVDRAEHRVNSRFWIVVAVAAVALQLLALAIPALANFPEAWTFRPAKALDSALEWFTVIAFPVTSALKTWIVFVVMLPLKIGFDDSVRPSFWGFEMSPLVTLIFAMIGVAITIAAWLVSGPRLALAVAITATLYYSGTTGVPWPAMSGLVLGLTYWVGGRRIAVLAGSSLIFILITGSWTNSMISVELTLVGVLISFLLGTAIGAWAALNDHVSAIVSPICDTLQTMPIFVFLIPAVMVFLVGEFTALIAVVMYAIVPSIRYAEHGLRNVPAEILEASRMMGASRWQVLWQVRFPVALPEIALGLNQTIMMALSMVIVAALVGAQGLGSDVMIALSRADTGKGLVAGLCLSLIAIVTDRTLQAWADSRRRALGLA